MRTISAVVIALIAFAAHAQDREWVRMWSEAQRSRPRDLSASGRIAPASEPGTPMVIHGRVFKPDGRTPAANVIVFAYHTDRNGVYNEPGQAGWRLRGWVRTGADGRFEFRTIRPGAYPRNRVPAHVHMTIEGPGVERQWAAELNFADDPYVAGRDASASRGAFGSVRPVTVREGAQHVEFNVRIGDEGTF